MLRRRPLLIVLLTLALPALMLAWLLWIGVVGFAINAAATGLQQHVARRMGEGRP